MNGWRYGSSSRTWSYLPRSAETSCVYAVFKLSLFKTCCFLKIFLTQTFYFYVTQPKTSCLVIQCSVGGTNAVVPLQGDSGGPLMLQRKLEQSSKYNYFLMGIVSYGHSCAKEGYPGVYTRVSMFMSWIVDNLDI